MPRPVHQQPHRRKKRRSDKARQERRFMPWQDTIHTIPGMHKLIPRYLYAQSSSRRLVLSWRTKSQTSRYWLNLFNRFVFELDAYLDEPMNADKIVDAFIAHRGENIRRLDRLDEAFIKWHDKPARVFRSHHPDHLRTLVPQWIHSDPAVFATIRNWKLKAFAGSRYYFNLSNEFRQIVREWMKIPENYLPNLPIITAPFRLTELPTPALSETSNPATPK